MSLRIATTRRANRLYRSIKAHLLVHRTPVFTWLFYRLSAWLDRGLSGRKQTDAERLTNVLWKQAYFADWNRRASDRVRVITDHTVAYSSDDHRFPRGTVFDNSTSFRFNSKLYELLGRREGLHFLDLGCAGGGLVRSYLEDGHLAVGLEGSDTSKRFRSGEWETITFHLFTCDITKPFQVVQSNGSQVQFDAVTAWEVFEHIGERDLGGLIDRIAAHVRPGGYFIGSIDLLPDGNPLTGAVYHKTLRPADWWEAQFIERGFRIVHDHGFAPEDMVRGHGLSLKDWHPADGRGMHLVAQRLAK